MILFLFLTMQRSQLRSMKVTIEENLIILVMIIKTRRICFTISWKEFLRKIFFVVVNAMIILSDGVSTRIEKQSDDDEGAERTKSKIT